MAGQHYSFRFPEARARDERVAVPGHLEVRQAAERALDRVGQWGLLAPDPGHGHEGGGELGAFGWQVKVVIHGDNLPGPAPTGTGGGPAETRGGPAEPGERG